MGGTDGQHNGFAHGHVVAGHFKMNVWMLQVVIEGMGRAIHSNLRTRFRCPALKLAMIKNARLAANLFNGVVYDCVCIFDPAADETDEVVRSPRRP